MTDIESTALEGTLDRTTLFLERLAGVLIVVLAVAYAGDVHRYLGASVYDVQLLVGALTLALTASFLRIAYKAEASWLKLLNFVSAIVTFAVGAYVSLDYVNVSMEAPYLPDWLIAVSFVLLGAILVNLKPTVGVGILAVVLIFMAYGLWGHLFPGELRSRPVPWSELVVYLTIDANGMLGTALRVAVVIVVPYLLFGQLLASSGAANFFNDTAMSMMGRFRGGPAKVSVVASSMFGTISGNAVGNVVGTGVVTIPMMKRAGFSPTYAGAVEATSSTGGQLVPPVMGAAAFIMADTIGVDYVNIMLAAMPAALLYYVAIFINVDLRAGKRDVRAVSENEIPSGMAALKAGWHFLIPFVVLFYLLFAWNARPERAAVMAILVLIVGSMVFGYKGQRPAFRNLLPIIAETGRSALSLIIVCAAAGIVIGVLSITGLAFNLTIHILNLSGNNVLILALVTAVMSVVLGLGMPTVGVYILLATLVAPALVEAGIPVIAAHLFVFYFGLLSMVTPPVALAAFAAANIAGANAWATSIESMKIAWPAYIVPFLFIFTPALVLEGSAMEIAWTLATAILGIYMVTAGIVGYFRRLIVPWERVLLIVGGILTMLPAGLAPGFIWTDWVGIAIFAACVVLIRPSAK